MAKVKIISNPYQKEIKYQSWNDNTNEWTDINEDNNQDSKLLSDELSNIFFPFVVKKIVDEVIKEYRDGSGKIELVFEGTDDEYKDLQEVCSLEEYQDRIILSKSPVYLENARDIVEDITDIFGLIRPLVTESFSNMESVDGQMKRFSDVSEDKIPICILGNYSSGKSTFINALIGREILPSGEEPITAKIYKIEKSRQDDRASIEFEYCGEKIKIRFDEDGYRFSPGIDDKKLLIQINDELTDIKNADFTIRINKALAIINGFDNEGDSISDLIEITVPFVGGIWNQTTSEFVIFDTPGSNSASNDKHFKILKSAIEGFSNGLPIYVSEFRSLDSTDNERLYSEIKGMEELDDRFTMIIINKADESDLTKREHTKEDEERILNLAVPRNLYSEGIFYVSSIMGLGSKTNGEFIEDHSAEIYEEKEAKFSNPESRFYKSLYKYNIMPDQLKQRSVDASLQLDEKDRMYANSGLYAVEREIQIFADKYSPYNKCKQAHLFLGKVIELTAKQIADTKQEKEDYKKREIERLDRDKKELINTLQEKSNELDNQFTSEYGFYMTPHVENVQTMHGVEEISQFEQAFIDEQELSQDIEGRRNTAKSSKSAILENLKTNFAKKGFSGIKEIGSEFVTDYKKALDTDKELRDSQHEAYEIAAHKLLDMIIADFTEHSTNAQKKLEEISKSYWKECTAKIKDELASVVTESSTLSAERKQELTSIIMDYQNIEFESAVNEIFAKEKFEKGLRFGKLVIGQSERLNIEKLTNKYNTEIASEIEGIYESIRVSHEKSLDLWMEDLMQTILENIVEYNPTLHDHAENIRNAAQKIEELEKRQAKLSEYTENIRVKMDWKTE